MVRKEYLSSAALACMIVASHAHAQAPAQAETAPLQSVDGTGGDQSGIGEIVVTAQRISSSAQKTPVAIEVFDAGRLATADVGSVKDLTKIAPNLTFTDVQGEAHLTLRGITSSDVTETGDPAVVVAYDGFYVSRPYTISQGLYDLQRIEVLKGPQGTLFGRNAVGGVVSVVSNTPSKQLEGNVGLEYGNYNTINTEGMFNLPVSDSVQLRAAFQTRRHDGYRDNTLLNGVPGVSKRQDDEDTQSGRLELAFQPVGGLEGEITAQYTHQGGAGDGPLYLLWAYDSGGFLIHSAPDIPSSKHYGVAAFGDLESNSKRIIGHLSYDRLPGDMTLTYIGGYDATAWHHIANNTSPSGPPTNYRQNEYPKTLNQELRLTSSQDGPLTWQVGAFYFQEHSGLFSQQVRADNGLEFVHFDYPKVDARSEAVYGQANYAFGDLIKVSGGLRYTHDNKSRTGNFIVTVADPANSPVINEDGRGNSSKVTYHAGVEITPTSRNMIYLKTDTGYKASGFNSTVVGTSTPKPESITAYEVGSKNRFWDNKLQVNVDGFYYKYTNLLSLQILAGGVTSTGSVVTNAKGATVYGSDLEVVLAPTSNDRISGQVSWLHARYTDFALAPIQPVRPADFPNCVGELGAQVCQLKGNTLPEAPNVTFTIDGEHTIPDVVGGDLTLQADVSFKSKIWYEAFNFADTQQNAYALFNASISYRNHEHEFTVAAYMYNIGDKRFFTNAEEFGDGGTNSYLYAFGAPRTFGMRFTKGF